MLSESKEADFISIILELQNEILFFKDRLPESLFKQLGGTSEMLDVPNKECIFSQDECCLSSEEDFFCIICML